MFAFFSQVLLTKKANMYMAKKSFQDGALPHKTEQWLAICSTYHEWYLLFYILYSLYSLMSVSYAFPMYSFQIIFSFLARCRSIAMQL